MCLETKEARARGAADRETDDGKRFRGAPGRGAEPARQGAFRQRDHVAPRASRLVDGAEQRGDIGLLVAHGDPDLPQPDPQTYVALVSKGYPTDEAALRRVIGSDAAYIGMMGSIKKRETVYAKLRAEGVSDELLA